MLSLKNSPWKRPPASLLPLPAPPLPHRDQKNVALLDFFWSSSQGGPLPSPGAACGVPSLQPESLPHAPGPDLHFPPSLSLHPGAPLIIRGPAQQRLPCEVSAPSARTILTFSWPRMTLRISRSVLL